MHATRGWDLARGRAALPRRRRPDARRLPRPPGARAGLGRQGRHPHSGARQDEQDRPRRQDDLRRPSCPARGGALPLAGRRPGAAAGTRAERVWRRRRDGRQAPRAAGRGGAVSPGVRAHRAGPRAARQFPARNAMSAPPDLLTGAIDALANGHDLGRDQISAVLKEIMTGNASEVQIAAFLIALRTKGETVDELAGLAQTMRTLATPVSVRREKLLDTAGTGGGRRTFNVSTTAALIAAGAGCTVAKHGNRSATGLSGSADVLEALGARIDLGAAAVAECIEQVGFGFMFAPAHHQATRYVVPVRRELAVRTIFNFLGPLTNPAGARRQLIGVSDGRYLETMAGALAVLGTDHALLVRSEEGLDELSISAATRVVEVMGEEIRQYN